MLYTFSLYNGTCQLYLSNKVGGVGGGRRAWLEKDSCNRSLREKWGNVLPTAFLGKGLLTNGLEKGLFSS